MYIIFSKNNNESAFGSVPQSGTSDEIIKQKPEQELTDLLSDILEEAETWRDKYRYLSLDEDGGVYIDRDRFIEDLKEQYENEEVTQEKLNEKVENEVITESEYEYITGKDDED